MINDLKKLINESNYYQELLSADFLYSPRYECFYVACSKNACSKTKGLLGSLQRQRNIMHLNPHGKPNTGLVSLDELEESHASEIIYGDSTFRFTFVRNPYDRIISCYQSRIKNLNLASYDDINYSKNEFRKIHQVMLTWLDEFDSKKSRGNEISFADFIKFICHQKDYDMNRHWLPQASSLHIDKINYDFIGRVENYSEDFALILKNMGCFIPQEEIDRKINATSNFIRRDFFTSYLADIFYDRYIHDFKIFNYEKESWLL